MVHVRHDGRSYDITEQQAKVSQGMSDTEVRRALTDHFDVPQGTFDSYVVDRPESGDIIVRPQAVYG